MFKKIASVLSVICFAVLAATTSVSALETQTIELKSGINTFAPYLQTGLTANDLCQQFDILSQVARYDESEQTMVRYNCDEPTTSKEENFEIIAHKGYMVISYVDGEMMLEGTEVEQKWHFTIGNNFLGLSFADQGEWEAHEICGPLADTDNLEVIVVSWWDTNVMTWTGHPCGTPINKEYRIKKGEAYMLTVSEQQPLSYKK